MLFIIPVASILTKSNLAAGELLGGPVTSRVAPGRMTSLVTASTLTETPGLERSLDQHSTNSWGDPAVARRILSLE